MGSETREALLQTCVWKYRQGMLRSPVLVAVIVLSIYPSWVPAMKLPKKLHCPACRAVVQELTLKVTNAPSSQYQRQQHADNEIKTTTNPDSKAKAIDYDMSGLKAIEMLDNLCDRMHGYDVLKTKDGKQTVGRSKMDKMYTDFMAFMRKSGKLGEDLDSEMEKEISKKRDTEASWQVQLFCEDVVEDAEDALSLAVRNFKHFNPSHNASETAALEQHICVETTKKCTAKQLKWAQTVEIDMPAAPPLQTFNGGM